MNKKDIEILISDHKRNGDTLYKKKRYDGAYYHYGYVVELALKRCICSYQRRDEFPPQKEGPIKYKIHDLDVLLILSGLYSEMLSLNLNEPLRINWEVINKWTEERRYQHGITVQEANDYRKAVMNNKNGVLQWLKKKW